MLHVYHVTDARNRRSIVEHGLLPRDTTLHNFPYPESLYYNAGVEAVYAHRAYSAALDWAAGLGSRNCDAVDIWELQLDDAEWEHDPHWDGAVRVREPIADWRCKLVAADLDRAAARAQQWDPRYDDEGVFARVDAAVRLQADELDVPF